MRKLHEDDYGDICTGFYRQNFKHGLMIEVDPGWGQIDEGYYKDGKPHGLWRRIWDVSFNGTIQELEYIEGK